jgi:hypothetical protein
MQPASPLCRQPNRSSDRVNTCGGSRRDDAGNQTYGIFFSRDSYFSRENELIFLGKIKNNMEKQGSQTSSKWTIPTENVWRITARALGLGSLGVLGERQWVCLVQLFSDQLF